MTNEQFKELCKTDRKLGKYFGGILEHIESSPHKPSDEQMVELYEAIAVAMDKPSMNDPIYYLGNRTLAGCFGQGYVIDLVDLPERIDGFYYGQNWRKRIPDRVMVNLHWWPTMTPERRVQVILHEIAHFDLRHDDNITDNYGPPDLDYLESKAQARATNLYGGR